MDDRSWMYRDSPQGLRRMDHCNGVQGFINFATSIPRNFTDGGIRCPCRKCKNLKFLHQDVVTMHLLTKGFMEDYLCWYAHGELFVPHETMVERTSGSTSSASNMHVVVDDNSNPYKNMTMDTMRMNQGHAKQMATTFGQEPSPMELFVETHVRSDDRQKGVQRLIDNRAQHFVGTYNNRLNDRYEDDLSTQPDSDPDLRLKAGSSGGPYRN